MNVAAPRKTHSATAEMAPEIVLSGGRILLALEAAQARGLPAPDELNHRLRWMEIRATLIDPEIASHDGFILSGSVDRVFAEFANASDAVRCAIELQRDIAAASAAPQAAPSMQLRIGIKRGDVPLIVGGNGHDVPEDALELAWREEPGHIVIDGPVREQLAASPAAKTYTITSLPDDRAQTPAFDVAVPALGARTPLGAGAQRQPSVAVLPFEQGGASADGYFIGGIAESIVSLLSGVSDLLVVSRESTLKFRGGAVDLKSVGRQLSVRYILTGSAERSGDRLRLVPRLVDVETGDVLWKGRYEIRLSRLFDLQEHISRQIVRALIPNLGTAELRRVKTKRPENLDAYDLVLHAMELMQRLNREDFAAARPLLDRAVAKDPGYGAAYTLLARWYMLNLGQGYAAREHAEQNNFLKVVSRAVELNPADAHALALLGHCKSWLFRDYDGALDCFELAFAASPNSAFAWGWSSPTCSYLGDGETAVAHAEHALRLSPYGPNAYVYLSALALAHYTDGAYAEAARWGRRTMAVVPGYAANLRILAASLAAAGDIDEAKTVARALLTLQPEFRARRFALGYSYKAKERNVALAEHLLLAGLAE
jgi:adenylate cyclase